MKNKFLLKVFTFLLLTSCSNEEVLIPSNDVQNVVTNEIPGKYLKLIEELSERGFNLDNFEYNPRRDEIIYERDIVFNEDHLTKAKNQVNLRVGVVSRANSGDISYFIDTTGDDAFPTNYTTPLKEAMDYWSDVHANITIVESDTEAGADIICRRGSNLGAVGFARFPVGNNVGNEIFVDNAFNDTFTANENLTLMLHEIGHALGFSHADSFLFTHVPGTNDANWHWANDCGSIMRSSVPACNWTSENSDWSTDDTTAINYIFNNTGDADGDGVNTTDEDGADTDPTNDDTDNDGIPDYLDTDDDGDGILTSDEDTNDNGNPMDDDADADGTPNYLDTDDDGDGQLSRDEGDGDEDEDGTPNYLDTDDDGDGILTTDEEDVDTDLNGNLNYLDADDDGDGINTVDEDLDEDGNPKNDDTDGDDIPNYLDDDDDGDGIITIQEDADVNGFDDAPTDDSDMDGIPNYLDTDDDGDGILTEIEGDLNDLDRDGILDYLDLTIHKQFFTQGFGEYSALNNSEPQNDVNDFESKHWGVLSIKSSSFSTATVVNNWLISPVLSLKAGDKVLLRVAGVTSRFELRLSTNEENPTLPDANNGDANDVGDFGTLIDSGDANIADWINVEYTIPDSVGNERGNYKIALVQKGSAPGQGEDFSVEFIEVQTVAN